MEFLYFLEGLRNPVCDAFFSLITMLGEETAFMAVAIIVFWCFSKFQGYFLLITGFIGTVVNQFLKMIFRIPRPWVKDSNFNTVESAKEAASGYSFPSGHTQSSVTLFGGVARANKNKTLRIIMIAICVLVPLSRMYLGVHTPLDVIVSIAVSLLLIFGGYKVFELASKSDKVMYIIIGALTLLVVAFIVFVYAYPFPQEVYSEANIHNLESARKNAYTMLGCVAGLWVIYPVEKKYVKFEVSAVWWAQILKVIIGLAIIILIKEVLRYPIDFIFNGHLIGRSVRYFLIVVTAGVIYPLTFKWFSKLGNKKRTV